MKVSIVITVLNEAESIPTLYEEICQVMTHIPNDFEIIFVDDGSLDNTARILNDLSDGNSHVVYIRHRNNYGKSAAYTAGFRAATGDIIITMDGDLQDDPNELPRFLEALDKNTDLVVGWKQNRLNNEAGKALPSIVFNWILNKTFDLSLHDSNCGFRAMRREVAESLKLYGDYYRFIPAIAHANGHNIREIPINHRKRTFGVSKYRMTRFWTSIFDILSLRFTMSFHDRPLQAFGSIAVAFLLAGSALEIYVIAQKLLGNSFQNHLAAMIAGVFLLIVGVQILVLGLIGVMIASQQLDKNSMEYMSDKENGRQ